MDNQKKFAVAKTQFLPHERNAFKRNYFKLWIKEKVNFPFIVQIAAIQKPRGLPLEGGAEKFEENMRLFFKKIKKDEQELFDSQDFSKIAPLINEISKLGLPKEKAKPAVESLFGDKFPWPKFQGEIKALAEGFSFDERWIPYLTNYVITGVITAPHDRLDDDAPPEYILEDWGIFNLAAKMRAQHSFLKKQHNKKTSPRAVVEPGKEHQYIAYLDNTAGGILPDELIHSYLQIGQLLWGDDEDAEDISGTDRKKVNLVKKRLERFVKAYCVSATDEDIALLRSLPKTT